MVELKDRAQAKLAGEPTAEKPNIFGEQRPFELPNSRIRVMYSTRYYRFLKNEDPPWWAPDQRIDTTAADFLAGRDPALAARV